MFIGRRITPNHQMPPVKRRSPKVAVAAAALVLAACGGDTAANSGEECPPAQTVAAGASFAQGEDCPAVPAASETGGVLDPDIQAIQEDRQSEEATDNPNPEQAMPETPTAQPEDHLSEAPDTGGGQAESMQASSLQEYIDARWPESDFTIEPYHLTPFDQTSGLRDVMYGQEEQGFGDATFITVHSETQDSLLTLAVAQDQELMQDEYYDLAEMNVQRADSNTPAGALVSAFSAIIYAKLSGNEGIYNTAISQDGAAELRNALSRAMMGSTTIAELQQNPDTSAPSIATGLLELPLDNFEVARDGNGFPIGFVVRGLEIAASPKRATQDSVTYVREGGLDLGYNRPSDDPEENLGTWDIALERLDDINAGFTIFAATPSQN